LAKEKQVVKNEKRDRATITDHVRSQFFSNFKNLYPETHPYNWDVIGSLDLQNATLDDVKVFTITGMFNNVTLTIAGDFDVKQQSVGRKILWRNKTWRSDS
jgi:zinc protease